MLRVLIVDDERPMLHALRAQLEARGYEVDVAETGERAVARATEWSYDLALVDLGLPGIDGIDVVHALRALGPFPIIVLSAWHDEAHKIRALDAGADDYLTKPFGMGELLARIRATFRRAGSSEPALPPVETSHFRIDLSALRATTRDGVEITLTPREWRVLEMLVREPGRLVTQRRLLEAVWGPAYVDQPKYVRQVMSRLRQKFEPDPSRPRYFLTQPGLGVRFVPLLALDDEETAVTA